MEMDCKIISHAQRNGPGICFLCLENRVFNIERLIIEYISIHNKEKKVEVSHEDIIRAVFNVLYYYKIPPL